MFKTVFTVIVIVWQLTGYYAFSILVLLFMVDSAKIIQFDWHFTDFPKESSHDFTIAAGSLLWNPRCTSFVSPL